MARIDDMVARYLTGLIETGAFTGAMPAKAITPTMPPMPRWRSAPRRRGSCCEE